MSRQRFKTRHFYLLNLQRWLTISRQRSKTRDYCSLNHQMQLTMSRQRSKTRDYRLLIFRFDWECQGKDPRQGIIAHWIFRFNWQRQGKDPRQGIIARWSSDSIDNVKAKIQDKGLLPVDLQIWLRMSRQRSKTRDYRPLIFRFDWECQGKDPRQEIIAHWIFRCNWQHQGKDPRQGIIAHSSSDSIDNVKAKIQDKGLSPVDLQIWLTMSRQRSKTRDYRLFIFRFNWQCQGKNPEQVIIAHWSSDVKAKIQDRRLSPIESSDAIDNVKTKIQDKELLTIESSEVIDNVKEKMQDKGLSPIDLPIQLRMSRQRFKTRDYRPFIFRFNWQCQGKDPRQGIIACWSSDLIDNVKAKIQNKGLLPVHLQVQLTMSRHRSKVRDYHPRAWIFTCHWQ